MAYRYIHKAACSTREECFQRFRDFMCRRNGTYDYSTTGVGWTLVDSSYAVDEDNLTDGDWFVMYSAGENGNEDMYQWIEYDDGYAPHCCGYLYWNTSTHVGVERYGYTNYELWAADADATSFEISMYGDLDCVHVFVTDNDDVDSYSSGSFIGKLVDGPYDEEVFTLTSAYSAGSNVVITLPSTPDATAYAQYRHVYIRDNDHIEVIQIESISGNQITVDLVNSYAIGAKICAEQNYITTINSSYMHTTSAFVYALIARDGTRTQTASPLLMLNYAATHAEDVLNAPEAYYARRVHLGNDAGFKGVAGSIPHIYYLPYSTGLVNDDLYVIRGVQYRHFYVSWAIHVLLREG